MPRIQLTNFRLLLVASLGLISLNSIGQHVQAFSLLEILPWVGLDHLKGLSEAILDSSNDEAIQHSSHELIKRAGFDYEIYYALADDGYITQLIRIVNPLADARYLKKPPIMIQHGQTANSRNFVMQSNSKHHPMRFPPAGSDERGPSSNRSLALMLANSGYDVWLTSTRGVDMYNQGYLETDDRRIVNLTRTREKNMTLGEDLLMLKHSKGSYWSFTLDDQIAHDAPAQIATILNVTGASSISISGYSNSALTTFAMLSTRPDIAAYVDTYIALAPVVYYRHLTGFLKWFVQGFMQLIPKQLDAQLFISDDVAKFLRILSAKVCKPLPVRYTVCKFIIDLFFGESSQFRTLLELPFFGHILRPTSWKCLAQHLQIAKTHKLNKFDYGRLKNKFIYNSFEPPEYNISQIPSHINIGLISAAQDSWATKATVDEIRSRLQTKPVLDLVIEDYNHVDLTAAHDVDLRVNLPILKLLDKRNDILGQKQQQSHLNPQWAAEEGQEVMEPEEVALEENSLEPQSSARSMSDMHEFPPPMADPRYFGPFFNWGRWWHF